MTPAQAQQLIDDRKELIRYLADLDSRVERIELGGKASVDAAELECFTAQQIMARYSLGGRDQIQLDWLVENGYLRREKKDERSFQYFIIKNIDRTKIPSVRKLRNR
jgi:hypothetical protein